MNTLLKTQEDTEKLAKKVAKFAVSGDLITLSGTLGMGKTTFARAFIRTLASDEDLIVPSPTFTLMQPYETTRIPVAHIDAYRMSDGEEIHMLDVEPYFAHGLTLIEWPEKIADALPVGRDICAIDDTSEQGDRLDIILIEKDGVRQAKCVAYGTWHTRLLWLENGAPENLPQPCDILGNSKYLTEWFINKASLDQRESWQNLWRHACHQYGQSNNLLEIAQCCYALGNSRHIWHPCKCDQNDYIQQLKEYLKTAEGKTFLSFFEKHLSKWFND